MRFICNRHQLVIAQDPLQAAQQFEHLKLSGLMAMEAQSWELACRKLGAAYEISVLALQHEHDAVGTAEMINNLLYSCHHLVICLSVLGHWTLVGEYLQRLLQHCQSLLYQGMGRHRDTPAPEETVKVSFQRMKMILMQNRDQRIAGVLEELEEFIVMPGCQVLLH